MKDRKGEIAFPSQDTQPTCLQGVMASSWPRAAQKHSAELFRASTRMRHRVFGPEEFISEASGPWTGFSVPVQRIEGEGPHRPGQAERGMLYRGGNQLTCWLGKLVNLWLVEN